MDFYINIFSLSLIILVAFLSYSFARSSNVPHSVIGIINGLILFSLFSAFEWLNLSDEIINNIIYLGVSIIIFYVFSKFEFKTPTTLDSKARLLKIFMFFMTIPFLAIFSWKLFDLDNILMALLMGAILLSSSDHMIKKAGFLSKKLMNFLQAESKRVTAFVILFAGVLYQIIIESGTTNSYGTITTNVLLNLGLGMSVGLCFGLMFFRFMRKRFFGDLSYIALGTIIILTFSFSLAIGGNPLYAVFFLGYFFGNVDLKKKDQLHNFSESSAEFFEVLIFMMLAFRIMIFPDILFIIKSALLFMIFIMIRYSLIVLSLGKFLKKGESVFSAFYSPKDSVTALLTLYVLITIPGFERYSQIAFMFIIISVFFTYFFTIYTRYSSKRKKELDIHSL